MHFFSLHEMTPVMEDPEVPDYLGKAAVPGVGKQRSQDRTGTLTHQAKIVHEADRGELFALFDGMGSKGQAGADAAEVMCEMVTDFYRLQISQGLFPGRRLMKQP